MLGLKINLMSKGYIVSAGAALFSTMYVIGGVTTVQLQDNDSFDGSSWTSKTNMPSPGRSSFDGATIDGTIYAIAGTGAAGDVDAYTPDTWASKTSGEGTNRHTVSEGGGNAYLIGGQPLATRGKTKEYNVVGDSWSNKADHPAPDRYSLSSCNLSNKIYIFYGENYDGASFFYKDCDEYDYSGNSWSNKTDGPDPTRAYPATACINSKAYCCSGNDSSYTNLEDTDEYDASGNSWASKTNLPSPARTQATISSIGLEGFLSAGTTGTRIKDTDKYTPDGDTWANSVDTPDPARQAPMSSSL